IEVAGQLGADEMTFVVVDHPNHGFVVEQPEVLADAGQLGRPGAVGDVDVLAGRGVALVSVQLVLAVLTQRIVEDANTPPVNTGDRGVADMPQPWIIVHTRKSAVTTLPGGELLGLLLHEVLRQPFQAEAIARCLGDAFQICEVHGITRSLRRQLPGALRGWRPRRLPSGHLRTQPGCPPQPSNPDLDRLPTRSGRYRCPCTPHRRTVGASSGPPPVVSRMIRVNDRLTPVKGTLSQHAEPGQLRSKSLHIR